MATKKTTTKKTTTKITKKPSEMNFVGVNCEGDLLTSTGPIQLDMDGYCIFPSITPNVWTTDRDEAKDIVHMYDDIFVDSCELTVGAPFCSTYEDFKKHFPAIEASLNDKENSSNIELQMWKLADKQIKFSI